MRKVEGTRCKPGLYTVQLCEHSFHFCIIGTDYCFRNMENGANEQAVVVLPSDTINLKETSQPLQPSSPLQSFNQNTFSETPITFKTIWPPSMDSPIPRLGSSSYTMDTGYQPELDQETDVSSTMDPSTIPRPYSRSQQELDGLTSYYGAVTGSPLPVEVSSSTFSSSFKTHYNQTDCSWRGLSSEARSRDR